MRLIMFLVVLSMLGACADKFTDYTPADFVKDSKANTPISEIRELYKINGITTFTRDYVVSGVVVANDLSGNFYKTFIIADTSAAVEIKAGLYDLHTLFPIGKKVSVKLKGLTCGADNGMIQLGLKAVKSSGYETDFIGHEAVVDKYVFRLGVIESVVGKKMYIKNLRDEMVGTLVTIDSLTLNHGIADKWADGAYPKDIVAKRNTQDSIFIFTSPYADFAQRETPIEIVSVTGIVMKKGKNFRLKLRDISDVQLVK